MKKFGKIFAHIASYGFTGGTLGALAFAATVELYQAELPDVSTLREVQLQVPLRIYTADKKLIAEYGTERRSPINYADIPPQLIHAILAAEDARFFEHYGIDFKGLSRAALQLISSGDIQSGGSTISMQVAKNYFLTPERSFKRKFIEILLAFKMEKELSKEEILELYTNKIYLGHRAYGVQAAANIYYGKDIQDLSLAHLATIAGIPKAPSVNNPISNSKRSVVRRNWILDRMLSLGYIDAQLHAQASQTPETARYHTADIEISAFYVAEMVRSELYSLFGEETYTQGLDVYTSIDSRLQQSADSALRTGLIDYHERHGYHGPENHHNLADLDSESRLQLLDAYSAFGNLQPALVLDTQEQTANILRNDGTEVTLNWEAMQWARPYVELNQMGPPPQTAREILKPGDVIRFFTREDGSIRLAQLPKAQGALVSMKAENGQILALSGGYSFALNNFNRATQAWRQPGSTLKPFLYATALEDGYAASSIVNDSPIVIHDESLEGEWRPENSSRDFSGPISLREALYRSRNLVSIRLMRDLGIEKARNGILKYGFNDDKTPAALSLSLGSSEVTVMQMNQAYTVFANGGYLIDPWLIDSVYSHNEPLLLPESASPLFKAHNRYFNLPDKEELRVLKPDTAFIIDDMLKDVVRKGTGRAALRLERNDLAGKTGTTNQQRDAWFSGYNPDVATTVWIGYDQPQPLGRSEFGGTAALPVWIDYMQHALADLPESPRTIPEGVLRVQVSSNANGPVLDYFSADHVTELNAVRQRDNSTNELLNTLFQ